MLARAEVSAELAEVWTAVRAAPREDWRAREEPAALAAARLLSVGLVEDAARLCELASGEAAVVRPLAGRLRALDRKWRDAADRAARDAQSATADRAAREAAREAAE